MRAPIIKGVSVLVALFILYTLSYLLKPRVVYVDKATNEIVSNFKESISNEEKTPLNEMEINKELDTKKVAESIKNDLLEELQAQIQIAQKDVTAKEQELPKAEGKKEEDGKSQKVKAAFVSLARNRELYELIRSIRRVEDRFNRKFNYDWVFFNDEPFTQEFIDLTTAIVSGKTKYAVIPKEHWSYPDWIDLEKAAQTRAGMRKANIIYGDSESYRHMCRFEAGFFWQNPILDEYKWYWRVEPDIQIYCDLDYDLFKYMEDNKKTYGFAISLHEFEATIPTLWGHTKEFMKKHPEYVAENNLMKFISDDGGETYNLCHFWSNFEIASLDFWRSKAYRDYFEYLDNTGGFFYERWGDAPIHSMAAALFLPSDQIHYFEDIGYNHGVYTQCPLNEKYRYEHKCHCSPNQDFTFRGYSCGKKYYDVTNTPKPVEWEKFT